MRRNELFWNNNNPNWCARKWPLDSSFKMPYTGTANLNLQLNISEFYPDPSFSVCEVYQTLPDGTRISPDLMETLGEAYWKANVGTDGLNVFTISIPPTYGGCRTIDVPNPNCCVLNLQHSTGTYSDKFWGWWEKGAIETADLSYNGATYDLIANELPPGWSWINNTYPKSYISVPCDVKTGDVTISGISAQISQLIAYTIVPEIESCPSKFCNCYLVVSESDYSAISTVILNGVIYNNTNQLSVHADELPGFSPPSMHTVVSDNWIIPISCDIDPADLLLFIPGGTIEDPTLVYVDYAHQEQDCVSNLTPKNVNCFMYEFVIAYLGSCGFGSIYTEPYECVTCDPIVKISSTYGGASSDLVGVWPVLNISTSGSPTLSSGALSSVSNTLFIPAILRNLPSKIAVTKNDKCFTYKSEVVETFELQGTKAYPPYFAKLVESVMTGQRVFANGREYQVRGDRLFESITVNGVSAYRLKATLELCSAVSYYDCQ